MSRQDHRQKGFTLVELMIVVAIVGLLAAIAVPQFLRFTWKSKRTEAVLALAGVRAAQLSYFSAKDHYAVDPDPIVVNEALGLGPIRYTAKVRYEFFYGTSNPVTHILHGTFALLLLGDLDGDTDPLDADMLCMHHDDEALCGAGAPIPDLTWVVVYDDVTNQWH